jgi:hypothetical protein
VLQAEILSEQGQEQLHGRPVDYVLAATPDEMYNGLVCTRLAPELGRQRVFQLAPPGRRVDLQRGLDRELRGRILGDPPLDFATLEARFEAGWRFSIGTAEAAKAELIVLTASGALRLVTTEEAPRIDPDDRVVSLEQPGHVLVDPEAADPQTEDTVAA